MTQPDGFETIARGFYLEALLIESDDIWYSDVARGGVRRVGTDEALLPERTMIGGLLANACGSLLVGGAEGIAWIDPASGRSGMLIDGLPGVNEMRPDGHGGIVFGTVDLPAILRGERPGPASLYRLSRDRELTLLRDGLVFANGFELARDGSALFFNESFVATAAFPVAADGGLGEKRAMADNADCDGMAQDADGNLWVTGFSSPFLRHLTPDGREIGRLDLPGDASTNVRFGGPDMRDLYVTLVDTASARALAAGEPLEIENSRLVRMAAPVKGAPIARAAFDLGIAA